MESIANTLTLPTFNGDHEKFLSWWIRFKAYATIVGFKQALTDEDDTFLPSSQDTKLDTGTTEGKQMEAAKNRNELAMACLILALTSDRLMGMVYRRSCTKEWPDGLAKLLVAALLRRYQPDYYQQHDSRLYSTSYPLSDEESQEACSH